MLLFVRGLLAQRPNILIETVHVLLLAAHEIKVETFDQTPLSLTTLLANVTSDGHFVDIYTIDGKFMGYLDTI